MSQQLSLLDVSDSDWWELRIGSSTVFVRAPDATQARSKAEAQLRDLGILPGGPPGLHKDFRRMCAFACKGRR